MKKRLRNKEAGVTLIELLIVIALMGIIVSGTFTMFVFGNKVVKLAEEEYEFQFSTRMVLDNTSRIVRYSTALFTIPESSFRENNLSSGWDYIGVNEVEVTPASGSNPPVMGNEIVKYTYDNTTDTHEKQVLLEAKSDVYYRFVFNKINPQDEDSLIQFKIEAFPEGSLDEYGNPMSQLAITSEVEALNSLQVIDLGSVLDPAAAVAFRREDRNKNVVGHVALVLDKSGSMAKNLLGYDGGSSRISILKTEAKTLIDKFALEDNIDISLVPFATSANNPEPFLNAKTATSDLKNIVNNLTAIGGTNTGDGLRRAYKALEAHSDELPIGVDASNYIIVLVDGVTTFASVVSNSDRSFITNASNVNEGYLDYYYYPESGGQIAGNGANLDAKGTAYVNTIGALIKADSFAKVYVIGFSAKSSELNSVNDIATACGATSDQVFIAESDSSLNAVFEAIQQDIVNDLWYLQGPEL